MRRTREEIVENRRRLRAEDGGSTASDRGRRIEVKGLKKESSKPNRFAEHFLGAKQKSICAIHPVVSYLREARSAEH